MVHLLQELRRPSVVRVALDVFLDLAAEPSLHFDHLQLPPHRVIFDALS